MSGFGLSDVPTSGAGSGDTGQSLGPPLSIASYTIKVQTAPGNGNSYTFNLRHAGSGDYTPANQCVISNLNTSCTFSGSTITTGAGDSINWSVARTGSNSPGWVLWSIAYS